VDNIFIVSYGGSLILLYTCILLYSQACKGRVDLFRHLITNIWDAAGVNRGHIWIVLNYKNRGFSTRPGGHDGVAAIRNGCAAAKTAYKE